MSEGIIIRVNLFASIKDITNIRTNIMEQMKTGLIVLPAYCEVLAVSDDVEISIVDAKGEEIC